MSMKKSLDSTVRTVAVIGSLVALNVVGTRFFARLDLTRDGQFTLSQATEKTLAGLSDPITIKAYFTRDLPPPEASRARYVRDLLDEIYVAADGMVRYELIDPLSEETEADKEKKKDIKRDLFGNAIREATSVERELAGIGIVAKDVPYRDASKDKVELRRAYMGIALQAGDKTEVIPFVESTAELEYDLTTLMRKLSRERTPKVALVTSLGPQELQQTYGRLQGTLGQLYDVTTVDLATTPQIPDDVDAILVLGPRQPFTAAQKQAIDAFVMSGRSAAFLLDAVDPKLPTLDSEPVEHGLGDLLAAYGVTVGDGLVVDKACATIPVTEQRGYMRLTRQVPYPLIPVAGQLDAESSLTRGLSRVAFPFVSPLALSLPEGSDVKGEVLVRSSEQSFVMQPPYNLYPREHWTADGAELGRSALLVTLSGPIPSWASRSQAGASVDPASLTAASARVLVAGSSLFARDQFLSPANEKLALNLVDWLLEDEDLLAVRSRGLAAAELDELGDGTRTALKLLNIAGLPLAFVLFGLVRWRMREARRSRVTL